MIPGATANLIGNNGPPIKIQDVFNIQTYNGANTATTLTTNNDLSTYGGLEITKTRNSTAGFAWADTARGITLDLDSSSTNVQVNSGSVSSVSTTGVTFAGAQTARNVSGGTYVNYSIRKCPGFFDVVTWTGTGTDARALSHALGMKPCWMAAKCTNNGPTNWPCWNKFTNSGDSYAYLNSNSIPAFGSGSAFFGNAGTSTYIAPTSTQFTVSANLNQSGQTYVAWLFADNPNLVVADAITAGNYVNLGWQPAFIMMRFQGSTSSWSVFDDQRGMTSSSAATGLYMDVGQAETTSTQPFTLIDSSGFTTNSAVWGSGLTCMFLAIRKGPM